MSTEDKVTEIFVMANEFCKYWKLWARQNKNLSKLNFVLRSTFSIFE